MMLNQMPAGRSEPQWTQYDPGSSDFEDCEYRVDEMEILGVKNRYIMIRGTVLQQGQVPLDMPAGVKPYFPMLNQGFVITCFESNGNLGFGTSFVTVNNTSSNVIFFTNGKENSLFRLFARVR